MVVILSSSCSVGVLNFVLLIVLCCMGVMVRFVFMRRVFDVVFVIYFVIGFLVFMLLGVFEVYGLYM